MNNDQWIINDGCWMMINNLIDMCDLLHLGFGNNNDLTEFILIIQ